MQEFRVRDPRKEKEHHLPTKLASLESTLRTSSSTFRPLSPSYGGSLRPKARTRTCGPNTNEKAKEKAKEKQMKNMRFFNHFLKSEEGNTTSLTTAKSISGPIISQLKPHIAGAGPSREAYWGRGTSSFRTGSQPVC